MEFVDLAARIGSVTGVISPTRYLRQLPELAGSLPPGARAFATDPDHYAFGSMRCTKDLTLHQLGPIEDEPVDLEAHFRHNCWKHDEDLVIRYQGVVDVRIETPRGADRADLDTVILDEILPHEHGCSHEIAFRPGTLIVTCRDLIATWVDADCPDKP
ncbi:hypothetical protein ACFVHB_17150 [Kitasatospora sp. NPDC127111]|uniref:hypothetical protein n=1 Tax=Kitasatospora sp. NPDC127111 TaxID=3345363 RepID=UPI00363B9082